MTVTGILLSAAVMISSAQPTAVEDIDARFQTAEAARRDGDFPVAYRLLSDLIIIAPDSERINFSYGLTCLAMGDPSRAELAFHRVLYINPGNHRARLELSRSLAASQRYTEARRELERVLAEDPPERVRYNVEAYLKRLQGMESAPRRYRVQLETGAFIDSNVNAGPDAEIIRIQPQPFGFGVVDRLKVGDASKPREDYGMYVSGNGSMVFDPGRPGVWQAQAGASAYANTLLDEHAYRLLYYQVHGAMRHQSGRNGWQIPLRYTHIYRGGDSLMQSLGIAGSFSRLLPPGNARRVALHADVQWREYTGRADRDGFYTYGGIAFDQAFGRKGHIAGISATYYHDFAEAAIYEKSAVRWGMHGMLNLPWQSAVFVRLHYASETYREREALAPSSRRDTQFQTTLGAKKQLNARMTVNLQHQYTHNNSTFKLYDHDRNITTLSTVYAF